MQAALCLLLRPGTGTEGALVSRRVLTDLRVESLYAEKRQPFGKKSTGMRHYGSKMKAKVLMFACSLRLLLGSRSVGPTATTRGPRATQTLPNASRAATQSRAGTQGRAASSRAPAQQRAPTAAGKARQGRSLRRGWPALLGKRRPEPHLELLSAKPLPWAATARREKP